MLLAFGVMNSEQQQALFSVQTLKSQSADALGGALLTAAVILVASLFKTAWPCARVAVRLRVISAARWSKRMRGIHCAGVCTTWLKRLRWHPVCPVPEIYVLEQESGINAFAAGFTPADAAVAVTRGALEKLSRNELQGVIAHEFSHIFNGDMRLKYPPDGCIVWHFDVIPDRS